MMSNQREKNEIRVLLHNIRSAHNIGAMFRTAEAIGVTHIYLSGYSPTPIDKWGRPVKEIAKTALGAENFIPWEYGISAEKFINKMKAEGFCVVGLEQDPRAVDYKSFAPNRLTLLLVGNEVDGIPQELRVECDALIQISMRGKKESLNVSSAFAVALFCMFDK